MAYGVVYLITNLINEKRYVGQTVTALKDRWNRHCWECTKKNSNMPISHAIDKYGKDNFSIEMLAEAKNQEHLNRLELDLVDNLNTWSPHGYNLKAGTGPGSMSEITKRRIGTAHKGRKATTEARRNMSNAKKGVPHPAERVNAQRKRMAGVRPPLHIAATASRKLAKTYRVLNPQGELIVITNMKHFCKAHPNLHLKPVGMCKLTRGTAPHYKGWTLP